jgi:outer membrane phospholipase A
LLTVLLVLTPLLRPGPTCAALPAHAPTYFAGDPSTRQLAFRYHVGLKTLGWTADKTGLYGLFSQSSFWYLDDEDRGYTVESNFAPEVQFYAAGTLLAGTVDWWPDRLDLGVSYSHHSNGIDGDLSRSWNHLNGGLYLGDPQRDSFSAAVVGWYPFNVEASNADIARYAGHGRIAVDLRPRQRLRFLGRTQLYLASHFSFDSPHGRVLTNLETALSFAPGWLTRPPFPRPRPVGDSLRPESHFGFFVQWVVGRGESLITYRRYQNTVRFGLRLW